MTLQIIGWIHKSSHGLFVLILYEALLCNSGLPHNSHFNYVFHTKFFIRREIIACSFILYACFTEVLWAQVGIGTIHLDPSAILDISSPNQGVLLPRVELKDQTKWGLNSLHEAAEGLMAYHTADSLFGGRGLYIFDGGSWRGLAYKRPDYEQWQWTNSGLQYAAGGVYIGANAATNNDLWLSRRLIDWDNGNYYVDPAAGSVLNEIKLDPGSTSDTSQFWDRSDTGFFAPNPGSIGLSVSGILRWYLSSDGRLGLNTADPQADLDVNGSFKLGTEGSVIQGVKRFSQIYIIPYDWAQDSWTLEIDAATLAVMNIPVSAYIHGQIRGALSRQLRVLSQGIDEQGYHLTLTGINPNLGGQSLELDFLVVY